MKILLLSSNHSMNRWQRLPLATQVGIVSLCLAFLGFGLLIAASLGSIYSARNSFMDQTSQQLVNQITGNAENVMREASATFSETLRQGIDGIVMPLSIAVNDTFNRQYSLAPVPSYSDNSTLKQPLVYDSRNAMFVSLGASSISFASQNGSNLETLFSEFSTSINATSHLDFYFASLYSRYTNFVSLYVGLQNGLFRQYPGLMANGSTAFDPRLRGWYTSAMSSSGVVVSDPYEDAFGRGRMITFSLKVSGIGVVGADMLMSTVLSITQDIRFRNSGQLSILRGSGVVVSSPQLTSLPFTVFSLQNPSIPVSLWETISSGGSGSTFYSGYILAYRSATLSNGDSLVLLMSVPLAEVNAPILAVVNSIDAAVNDMTMVASGASVTGFVLALALSVGLTLCATRPMNFLERVTRRIAENLGEKNLMKGVDMTQVPNGIGHISDVVAGLRELVALRSQPPPQVNNSLLQFSNMYPAVFPSDAPALPQAIPPPSAPPA